MNVPESKAGVIAMIFLMVGLILIPFSCNTEKEINGKTVPCVGLTGEQNPNYVYSLDVWNTILTLAFFPGVIVPAVNILTNIQCPVRERDSRE